MPWAPATHADVTTRINAMGEIDSAERGLGYTVTSTTFTPVDGLYITVPPQTRPYLVEFDTLCQLVTGTAAVATWQTIYAYLYEYDGISTNTNGYAMAAFTAVQVTAATRTFMGNLRLAKRFPPTTITRYYRISAALAQAAPTGWTTAEIVAADSPAYGFYQPSILKAVQL